MLDGVMQPVVADQVYPDTILVGCGEAGLRAVGAGECRIRAEKKQDRHQGQRQREDELRRSRGRLRTGFLCARIGDHLTAGVPCMGVTRRGSTPYAWSTSAMVTTPMIIREFARLTTGNTLCPLSPIRARARPSG